MKSPAIKKRQDYDLIASCWHEASHAIYAIYNYFYVDNMYVSIRPNKVPFVHFYTPNNSIIEDKDLKRLIHITYIQIMYAGSIGELIYYQSVCGSKIYPKYLMKSWGDDIDIASQIIRNNDIVTPGKRTRIFKKQMKYEVNKLLSEYWNSVKVVAHYLYKNKRISGKKLRFLLTRKTDNKELWKKKYKLMDALYGREIDKGIYTYLSDEEIKEILFENNIISI